MRQPASANSYNQSPQQEGSNPKLIEPKLNKREEWVPILSPSSSVAGRAREAIDAIAQALVTQNFVHSEPNLGRNRAYEAALLYGYLGVAYPGAGWADRAVEALNTDIEKADQPSIYLGLHGGLCGLGWTVEHLSRLLEENSPGEGDAAELESATDEREDLTADINTLLLQHLRTIESESVYDLIGGLVGFGVYFLERWPNPAAVGGIKAVFERLEDLAEHTDEGITWHTGTEQLPEWQIKLCPEGYYNVGVAHGVPGIIHFLAQIANTGAIQPERLRCLLNGAITWLLAQRRSHGARSLFPSWVVPGQETSDSRFGWCYGDLGILSILLPVTQITGREDWRQFARDLLDHCLAWPTDHSDVADAPLCHGAAGVAHIFNRIYQAQGDPRCRDAAVLWIERALDMRQPGACVGGFSSLTRFDLETPSVWEANPGFLDGAIGIALALLAMITPVEPKWDRLLLLSQRFLSSEVQR